MGGVIAALFGGGNDKPKEEEKIKPTAEGFDDFGKALTDGPEFNSNPLLTLRKKPNPFAMGTDGTFNQRKGL